MSCCLKITW